MSMQAKRKYPAILLMVLLMIVVVVMVGESFIQGDRAPVTERAGAVHADPGPLLAESGIAAGLRRVTRFADQGTVNPRTLDVYYARRAYPGAPPVIPHPVDQDMNAPFSGCAACHTLGGFVPRFNAFTPVTPHPEMGNCRQCHVPASEAPLFADSRWRKPAPPVLGRAALPGGPPPIPHTLQLRGDCVACHTGPAAPVEIRTGHPERVNCRQCHVPAVTDGTYAR